jgi:hypothetical protein
MMHSALRLVFTQSLCLLMRPSAITAANITITRIDLVTDITSSYAGFTAELRSRHEQSNRTQP